ncbi:MarR family winged helix-turn-helix transcriptional regulator [Sphingomonas bacterium]|uniref:MarR family winged helix-turn-helix transcriptional regulator n=1 Tax=Sphingomonas bacterium TaxID=1895847 RepID=UPI00157502B6|nr:MarR family transcriptional regulator [Sphingomonas bacterium]
MIEAAQVEKPSASVESNADWRTRNVGRLLFAATNMFVRHKSRSMRGGGVAYASDAMMALVLNLDVEGTRLTTLAARAGQTKQSMIELVDKAEALRIVERSADPRDLRAKIVRFTPDGVRVLEALENGIRQAEAHFADVVGAAFLEDMTHQLSRYIGLPPETPSETVAARWRERNAGRILALAARRFARDLLRFVHERGHREVTQVLLVLFRNLDLDGTRLTTLAARGRMTKQSMRELVDRAEALGLVERRPDPVDRRAKTVAFMPAGLIMLDEMRCGVALAEARFESIVGQPFAHVLRKRLNCYLSGE